MKVKSTAKTPAPKITLYCQECDKTFKRSGAKYEYKCPKCHGYDIDVGPRSS